MDSDFVKLKDIKPALASYIRKSQDLFKLSAVPDEKVIHDVRVLMKKARATLRLTASQMEKEIVDREIVALREVGRIMNAWRESYVLRKTMKELKKNYADIFSELQGNAKLENILKKSEPADGAVAEVLSDISSIEEILKDSGFRIRFEPMNKLDPQILLKQLEVTYGYVVNSYLISRNYPKPSNIHNFRKRTKDFLYQLWFFRPLNIQSIKALEKKLDKIAQNLGKYNDYAQLIRALDYKYEFTANSSALDELAVIIRHEQDHCLAMVWPYAHKIFCPGQKLVNILGFKLLVI